MKLHSKPSFFRRLLASSALPISACSAAYSAPVDAASAETDAVVASTGQAVTVQVHAPEDKRLPLVKVHKDPCGGCCGRWANHMQAAGFPVEIHDTGDMAAVKERGGIGDGMTSCHISEIDGYVVEGQVPVDALHKLLAERPKARCLVLPGMPIGSPGMESPDGYREPFVVSLLEVDGNVRAFSQHP
ncbi:MAG: DUF411 domain-containing protein [Stenotrophomonas sp.]